MGSTPDVIWSWKETKTSTSTSVRSLGRQLLWWNKMERWVGTCLLLCLVGLMKELRPSEPFVTEFLIGPWKNFTIEEVCILCKSLWNFLLCFIFIGNARYLPSLDLFLLSSSVCGFHYNWPCFLQASCSLWRNLFNYYLVFTHLGKWHPCYASIQELTMNLK